MSLKTSSIRLSPDLPAADQIQNSDPKTPNPSQPDPGPAIHETAGPDRPRVANAVLFAWWSNSVPISSTTRVAAFARLKIL